MQTAKSSLQNPFKQINNKIERKKERKNEILYFFLFFVKVENKQKHQ